MGAQLIVHHRWRRKDGTEKPKEAPFEQAQNSWAEAGIKAARGLGDAVHVNVIRKQEYCVPFNDQWAVLEIPAVWSYRELWNESKPIA